MDAILIEGGKPLRGRVRISGSKNAALPVLIATLLTDETCQVANVPELDDIETVMALLTLLGKKITRRRDSITVQAGPTLYAKAPYEVVRRMRASAVVMGPLLARLGHAAVSLPGGCAIGSRPINIHLDGFRALGARVTIRGGYVHLKTPRLKGSRLVLDFPSVGATENLLMAATLARGETLIENAAREPEIVDLAHFLTRMGALIQGAGTTSIRVQGVSRLKGAAHSVIPDRIETGTYLLAAAITRGELVLEGARPDHLEALFQKLRKAGVHTDQPTGGEIRVHGPRVLRATDIETAVYPGFPTDLQAQWMSVMCLARGSSRISERVFENRFLHVAELQRMGADIHVRGATAIVKGAPHLTGAPVMVSDLRAGAALVLAGLAAQGQTKIHRVYHLDRGYAHLVEKLRQVGARIRRIKT